MSSQEVVDFIQSKISQRDENGELRLLSSIVEEVSLKLEEGAWFTQTDTFFFFFFGSFFSELGTEPRALRFLGKRSTTELNPQPRHIFS